MKRTDLAYIAGFFDGEGCIHLNRVKRQNLYLRVVVVQTNEWIIQWLKYSFGGQVYKMLREKDHHKQRWQWHLYGNQSLEFLKAIRPYLILKRTEAELAIKFQQNRKGTGHKITETQKVIEEAERILMVSLKDKSK